VDFEEEVEVVEVDSDKITTVDRLNMLKNLERSCTHAKENSSSNL